MCSKEARDTARAVSRQHTDRLCPKKGHCMGEQDWVVGLGPIIRLVFLIGG